MEKTIRFFKFDSAWYADVAGHTLEDNEMVAGADTFLEEVDRHLGSRGEVFIKVADRISISCSENEPFLAKFIMKRHDECGAEYLLSGPLARQHDAEGFEIWICNVTHDVLGEHPQSIYILDIF